MEQRVLDSGHRPSTHTVVRTATDDDSDRWNAFVDKADGAEIYHRYEWRRLLEDVFGQRTHYLLAEDAEGELHGVLPVSEISSALFGRFMVSIPYFNYCGVLADSPYATSALLDNVCSLASKRGASHVELRHRSGVELELTCRSDKVAMLLDLPGEVDDLWKGFSSKLRAQIRRPQKAGAECRDGGLELLGDFYRVFSRNMRDLGTPVFPKSMFARMLELFPESTRVFVVYLDDTPAAAGITLGYRDRLEIPVASSLREFNRQAVNMLLYWCVLEHAVDKGYSVFDFGRSTVDSGPHRFKKQWGARPEALNWHYWLREGGELPQLNPSNPKFELATAVWRRMPVPIATFLGPRIVRYLA